MSPQPAGDRRERGPFPVHPLLLAAFPVLFLFAENAVQQVTLDPLWEPLGAALAAAGILMLAAAAAFRDFRKGALVASVLLLLFFSFGHVWNLVRDTLPAREHLAAIYVLVALAALVLAWRGGGWLAGATRAANVAAGLLVAFNVFRIVQFALGVPTVQVANASTAAAVATPETARAARPDIYYVILDRYSNGETLDRLYGFDNEPFLRELERRGFVVARESWANYLRTPMSLVSSMSMDFLDGDALAPYGGSVEPLHQAFRDHLAVPVTLKQLGYEYIHVGSAWEPTATNVDADRVLRWQPGSEFATAVLGTSAWSLSQPDVPPNEDPDGPTDNAAMIEHLRQDTFFQFDTLEATAGRPGPQFVFAHILAPHNPWRFNADGSAPTAEQLATRTRDEWFLEHVQWTNSRVLQMLDTLLDVPEAEKPIVIIQADEGEFPTRFARDQEGFDWLEATPDEVQHKFGILNAVHYPGVDPRAAGFHDRITPVNQFRVLFNAYFDAGLPLLPDTTFLSPVHARLYEFVEYERPD